MQMTTEARQWLDEAVRRILAPHALGEAERAGITYELMSHLHAAGEALAKEAGRDQVGAADLQTAMQNAGGEAGLAEAFVQPLSKPTERVLLGRRAGAALIDLVLVGIVVGFVHGALTMLLQPLVGSGSGPWYPQEVAWLVPWGFHDVALAPLGQLAILVASLTVVLGYYTWLEANDGRTLGKRALELRVMRVDGRPMTQRDALVRNLVKLSPPLFALDILVMLLAFSKERQRLSDRIAETIVVRA